MSFAQEYMLFYGHGCNNSAEVLNFIKDHHIDDTLDIETKEVYYNKKNFSLLNQYLKKHDLNYDSAKVPFLIVGSGDDCNYVQ